MSDFFQDIRYAARALLRQPALSAAVVLTLALGVGINGAVFSIVNAYLFRPLPARDPQQIVLLGTTTTVLKPPHEMSWPDFRDYGHLPVFQDAAGWVNQTVNLGAAGGHAERVYVGETTANYFSFLGVAAAIGRTFLPGEDREPGGHRVMVLTHGFWVRHFDGDSTVIGRTVPVNGLAATIVGVLPASFRPVQSLLDLAVYMPLNQAGTDWTSSYEQRDNSFLNVAARLAPGVGVGAARASATALALRLERENPATRGNRVVVVPEKRARPILFIAEYTPIAGTVFLALTTLVLLVACANVAGLLLSRTASRQRELAVRAALGARRGRIARLLLIESTLLGLAGGLIALGVAAWTAGLLASLRIATDAPVRFDVAPDWRVFAFTLVAAVVAGMLAGAAPAWRGSMTQLQDSLKSGSRTASGSRQRLRSALVVAQVAVAIVVLACAGMFIRSVQAAARLDLGFRADGVLLAAVSPGDQGYGNARTHALADRILEAAGAIPGVKRAAIARRIPIGYNNSMDRVAPEGGMPDGTADFTAFTNVVSPGYFGTMGIPLIEGRDFQAADDSTRPTVAVVSRAFAQHVWPAGSPVGRHFKVAGDTSTVTVVGVAGNTVWMGPANLDEPFIYYPLGQHGAGDFTLHLKTDGDPLTLAPALRAMITRLDGDLPLYDLRSMREHLDGGRAFFFLRLAAILAGAFGALALALGAVGLFGLIAFGVEQRRREIGIRLALGADTAGVRNLMLRGGLKLVALGLVIGVPAALLASSALKALLVGVPAHDPLAISAMVMVLLAVGTLAAWLPARRVAAVDPMDALRSD